MTHHALVNNEYLLALGLTLYHVLWQGAAVGLLGLAFTVFLRRSRPQARYIAAYSALVFMTALTLGTLWWCTPARNAQEAPAVAAADKQPATFLIVPTRPRRPLPSPEQALASLAITAPTWAISAQRPLPLLLRLDHQLYAAAPWLGVAWLGGIALMALRLLASLAYTQSLRHIGARPVEQRIAALLEDIALRMRVSRAVRALESVRVKTPCIIGTLRPVILLPAAVCCGLTPAALGAVLAHELAHIRRHDFLLNLLQNVMLTLLFFHPAAWWLSRRIRIERELCCDDLAVATHGNPHAYAEALSRLAELAHSTSALAPAMSDGSLVDRIRYVLAMPEQRQHGARGLAGGAVLATIVLLLVFGSLGGPQEARAQQSPPQVPVLAERTLQFPGDRSMGTLEIMPAPGQSGSQRTQDARGTVHVPTGHEAYLSVQEAAVADLSPLASLPPDALQGISLRQTSVTDQQLSNIQNQTTLRRVHLGETSIGDEALSYLQNSPTIEYINVRGTQITDTGVSYLQDMTNMTYFCANLTEIGDDSLAYLQNMTQMDFLDLWDTNVTDRGAAYLQDMTQLRELGLENTQITDAALPYLSGLTKLDILNLEHNAITDAGLQYLQWLTSLRNLDLASTYISEEGLQFLASLTGVRELLVPINISPEARSRLRALGIGIEVPSPESARVMRIVDADTSEGISGAVIECAFGGGAGMHLLIADAAGTANFYLPARAQFLRVLADAEGYATGEAKWTVADKEMTLALAKATVIGGRVVNPAGQGIAGAQVLLPLPGERDLKMSHFQARGPRTPIKQATVITEEDGYWATEGLPDTLEAISITLKHPAFADTTYEEGEVSMAKLLDMSAVLVMEAAAAVSGTVIDETKKPVSNAAVRVVEEGAVKETKAETFTDKDGQFVLENWDTGPVTLQVSATGFLSTVKETNVSTEGATMTITLQKLQPVLVRVMDAKGEPIEGARVSFRVSDKNLQGKTNTTEARAPVIVLADASLAPSSLTGADGRVAWPDAPRESVTVFAGKVGYLPSKVTTVSADRPREEVTIVLESITASLLLDQYQRVLEAPKAWTITARTERTMATSTGMGRSAGDFQYFRDGVRRHLRTKWEGTTTEDRRSTLTGEELVTDSQSVLYMNNKVEGSDSPPYVVYSETGAAQGGTCQLLEGAAGLEGYFANDPVPAYELLREAETLELRSSPALVHGGGPCYVLHAQHAKRGDYTLFFGVEDGLLRRVEVKKGPEHQYGRDTAIDSNQTTKQSVLYLLEQIEWRNVEGVWIPMTCHWTTTEWNSDGVKTTVFKGQHTRTSFVDKVSDEKAFQTEIPDGTLVTHREHEGKYYIWLDGKPVLGSDKPYLGQPGFPLSRE